MKYDLWRKSVPEGKFHTKGAAFRKAVRNSTAYRGWLHTVHRRVRGGWQAIAKFRNGQKKWEGKGEIHDD